MPTNVVGRNETVLTIRLDWDEPVDHNGIITGYRVSLIITGNKESSIVKYKIPKSDGSRRIF